MKIVVTVAMAGWVLAGARPAGAAGDDAGVWAHRVSVEAHAGLGTPLGLGGVAVGFAPAPWLSATAGLGMGLGLGHDPTGAPQLAFMPRIEHHVGRASFGLGVGVSAGGFAHENFTTPFSDEEIVERIWKRAVWGNAELSIEGRAPSGFLVRGYAGAGKLLNDADWTCGRFTESTAKPRCEVERSAGRADAMLLPYLGVAVGKAW